MNCIQSTVAAVVVVVQLKRHLLLGMSLPEEGQRPAAAEFLAATRYVERPASCPIDINTGHLRIPRTRTETESDLEDSAHFYWLARIRR